MYLRVYSGAPCALCADCGAARFPWDLGGVGDDMAIRLGLFLALVLADCLKGGPPLELGPAFWQIGKLRGHSHLGGVRKKEKAGLKGPFSQRTKMKKIHNSYVRQP